MGSLVGMPNTLVELLRRRADHQPQRRAFTFLLDGETDEVSVSYAELDRRARMIGARLQERHAPGSRALLLYPPGLDYIAAFFGCLYAGIIAVPIYPPRQSRLDRSLPRLLAITANAEPALVLTTSAYLAQAGALAALAPGFRAIDWIATDGLDGQPDGWEPRAIDAETIAFLQYTSGSTGAPKGVVLQHAHLLHNSRLIAHAFGHTPDSQGVIWLPPYHDMGLIGGIIQPLYGGFPVTLMAPVAFLQRPIRWLEAITRCGATTSGGPNFAFDLCTRKIPPDARESLDLRSWRVAFNGAEPIRPETLERFAAAFAVSGFRREAFYPCYGLAEATLIVTGGAVGAGPSYRTVARGALEAGSPAVDPPGAEAAPEARTLVGCGQPLLEQTVVIVDPATSIRCQAGVVGEIWIGGPSVARGYWNQDAETQQTFRARLHENGANLFLRTGDLGFIAGGELFVTGRLKDLIIIRGRNLYPQDIEQTVEQRDPLLRPSCGAAFAIDLEDGEGLVVVQEVERQYQRIDLDALIANIRQAIADQYEVQTHAVVLIKPGAIPKTSSGKIQRHACRAGWLAGTLDVIAASILPDKAENIMAGEIDRAELVGLEPPEQHRQLAGYLKARIAQMLGLDIGTIAADRPVTTYGLDSLAAVELSTVVERDLGAVMPMVHWLEGLSVDQLAGLLLKGLAAPAASIPIAPGSATPHDAGLLSYGQRALWFLDRLSSTGAAYTIARAFRIGAELDVGLLRRVLQQLVDRHASLRTTFTTVQREPRWQIHARQEIDFHLVDASAWDQVQLDAWLNATAHRPFDLERGPLFKVYLCTHAVRDHVLLLVVHHIVSDLWSLALLASEAAHMLVAERAGRQAALPAPRYHYHDFVDYQAALLAGPAGERLLSYWRDQLTGAPLTIDLPADHPRPPAQQSAGALHRFRLDAGVAGRLRELSTRHAVTLYTTLLAAFAVLLFRHSGQTDLLVGSPTTGRSRAMFTDIVGYFVNMVVLRADCSGNPPFSGLLQSMRRMVLAAFAHDEYPFPLLVERLQPERDPSRSPIFQVVFALQQAPHSGAGRLADIALEAPGSAIELGPLRLETLPLPSQSTQFDLTLSMVEGADGLEAVFQYNRHLFEAATIARMAGHLQTLLGTIAAGPEQPIATLPLLTASEQYQLVVEWNDSATEYPRECSVVALFEAQAARFPDHMAAGYEQEQITYSALNARANQLAHHLGRQGVGPDTVVGLCVERSIAMLVGMLGILKAGGAYVPLDPGYPAERLSYMLEDSGVRIMLVTTIDSSDMVTRRQGDKVTEAEEAITLSPLHPVTVSGLLVIDVERDWWQIAREGETNPNIDTDPDQRAYVIYTSGSTGRPKGVMVRRGGLLNLCYGLRSFFDDEAVEQTGLITSISFDASVNQIFPTLLFGRTLHIVPDEVKLESAALLRFIQRHNIQVLDGVPSHFLAVLKDLAPRTFQTELRYLLIGGEKLETRLLEAIFSQLGDQVAIVNVYGLTEISDINAFAVVHASEQGQVITVGRPLQNNRIYLTNPYGALQPVGVTGEVCISGESLSRGYLNRPELTAEKFVPCPFEQGALMCRTGDQGKRLPDGQIVILGRGDHQVKLRGFRIELGEIEAVLLRHPSVREGVVVVREDTPGDQRLVAYLIPYQEQRTENKEQKSEDGSVNASEQRSSILDPPSSSESVVGRQWSVVGELRAFLKKHLPDYMVPSTYVLLDALPLTPNGKIDRRALPAPAGIRSRLDAPASPRTFTEERLLAIWRDSLRRADVGVDDNFFELGGHSLLATQVVEQVRETFQIELQVRTLFEHPTIAELAALIDAQQTQPAPEENLENLVELIEQLSPEEVRRLLQERQAL